MLESHVSIEFTIVYSLRTYHCASIFDLMILLSRGRLLSQVADNGNKSLYLVFVGVIFSQYLGLLLE
jgi:hypothetical protein